MPLPALPVLAGGGLLMKFLSAAFVVGIFARIIAALGLSFFAFTGVDIALDNLQAEINSTLTGMPIDIKQILDLAGVTTILFWMIQAHAFSLFLRLARFSLLRTKAVKG